MMFGDYEKAASEFEELYEEEITGDIQHPVESFSAELLELEIETLEPAPAICVSPDTRVIDAINGMAERDQGCVLVTENDRLVGIFSERDVLRRVVGKVDPRECKISQVMTPDPEAVSFV